MFNEDVLPDVNAIKLFPLSLTRGQNKLELMFNEDVLPDGNAIELSPLSLTRGQNKLECLSLAVFSCLIQTR
jgi:hypothetical protein